MTRSPPRHRRRSCRLWTDCKSGISISAWAARSYTPPSRVCPSWQWSPSIAYWRRVGGCWSSGHTASTGYLQTHRVILHYILQSMVCFVVLWLHSLHNKLHWYCIVCGLIKFHVNEMTSMQSLNEIANENELFERQSDPLPLTRDRTQCQLPITPFLL